MDFIPGARAVHRTAALHFPLIVAAAIWTTPVLALDQRNTVCEPGGYMDYRMSPGRRDQKSSLELGCNDLLSAGGMIDVYPMQVDPIGIATQVQYWSVADGSSLSPLRNIPVFFSGTAQSGNNRHEEQSVRPSGNPIPEPGIWVVLIAGFLGMCAVAKRRIFSS